MRPLFVFEHQQPLARSIELEFKRHHALIGCRKPLIKPAVFFTKRLAFAGLLGKPRFEIDDLRAPCGDIDGDLCFRSLERTQQVLRRRKLLTQRLTFLFRKVGLFLEFGNLVAQLAVSGARVVEHRLQTDLFGFFGFEGAQRLAHRIDKFADGILDTVELADLGIGVEQQVAQRFILAAKLGAKRREQLFVKFERIVSRRSGVRCRIGRFVVESGSAGEKAPEFVHWVIP